MNTQAMTYPATPMAKWSKDHWSLLAYVETLCVDAAGTVGSIDRSRMRCNNERHPLMGHSVTSHWQPSWGSRLAGFFDFEQRGVPAAAEAAGLQLTQHDDWDCLDDLAAAGLVDTLSMVNGQVRLTPVGVKMCARLREFKIEGGMYARFNPSAVAEQAAA